MLAKWPPVAPTKAMRSPTTTVHQALPAAAARAGARTSSASYTAIALASCTNMPGSPLLPELSHTT